MSLRYICYSFPLILFLSSIRFFHLSDPASSSSYTLVVTGGGCWGLFSFVLIYIYINRLSALSKQCWTGGDGRHYGRPSTWVKTWQRITNTNKHEQLTTAKMCYEFTFLWPCCGHLNIKHYPADQLASSRRNARRFNSGDAERSTMLCVRMRFTAMDIRITATTEQANGSL